MKNFTYLFLTIFSISFVSFSQSVATYQIKFINHWNETDHGPLPNNAHWSKLVGTNHNSDISFIEEGNTASLGVENIAEDGSNTTFYNTVAMSINNGNSEQYIDGSALYLSNGSSLEINNLQISETFSLLTLLSMIAPSPDWMIFINSLELRDSSGWKSFIRLDLFAYDAGTEEGEMYIMNNVETVPQEKISSLKGVSPFNTNKVATLEISLQTVLSVKKDSIENVKIYPNPTQGDITISNITNMDLKTIKIYTVLGELMKQIPVKNTNEFSLKLNLSHLNKGLYIIKLETKHGVNKTHKLIIN